MKPFEFLAESRDPISARELGERARRAGFQLACIPAARMWHKVSRSADKVSTRSRYNQARGRIQFYRTLPPQTPAAMVAGYVLCKTAAAMARDLRHGRWDLARSTWQGAYDGLRA